MKTKRTLYSEWAYVAGILALALGAALMERADFGMSMVVAPAYLLHLQLSQYLPWYTFGVSEFVLQAVLLLVLSAVMGRFRKGYLFSFVTAVIYGLTLDGAVAVAGLIPYTGIAARFVYFLTGMLLCSIGVSLLFHTYIAPEAYELFVKELAARLKKDTNRVKTVYDCCSCLLGIVLSFAFFGFGHFEGVKLGTVFCAAVNGWLIGRISRVLESVFDFRDGLRFRPFFEA